MRDRKREKPKDAGGAVPEKIIREGIGNSFPVPMLILDRDMKVIHANRLAAESLAFNPAGNSREEIDERLSSQNGGEANPLAEELLSDRVMSGETVRNVHFHFRNTDGDIRLNVGSAGPVNSGGKVVGMVAVWHDITEQPQRKAFEAAGSASRGEKRGLAELREDIDQNRRLSSIGTLAATVAHELRNPLGVIRTAAYNLHRKNSDPLLEKHIDNIQTKIDESVLIIDNLLNYSRLQRPQKRKLRISKVITDSVRSVKELFPDKDVTIRKQLKKMRGRALFADPEQIREVFVNIIKNGFQAIEKGGRIDISASVAGRKVKVEISDNGRGVDEEELDRVFDPFFTGRARGTGLGLSICRELTELHGGSISIRSEKGSGTVVTVELPLERKGHE